MFLLVFIYFHPYFQPRELGLGAVECNSQEISITRGKKRVRAAFPYLETAKYEKEINGFLVEKQNGKSLVVSRFLCPHQALQNRLESRWGREGRREDGQKCLEGWKKRFLKFLLFSPSDKSMVRNLLLFPSNSFLMK